MATPLTQSAHDAAPAPRDPQSLLGLMRRLTAEISTLFRQEVKLARNKLDPPRWVPGHSIQSIRRDKDVLARKDHE